MIEPNMAVLFGLAVVAAALLGAFAGVDLVRKWLRKRQSTPLKARKGPLEARSPQDGTIPPPLTHKHLWRFEENSYPNLSNAFYKFRCAICKQSRYILKSYFWDGPPGAKQKPWEVTDEWMTLANPPLKDSGQRDSPVLVEALEAIRFTQEYAQLPCVDGWSWWDFYKKYRPDDAKRLKNEWEAFERHSPGPITDPEFSGMRFTPTVLTNEPC